jgi:hypothetical protein
VRLGSFFPILPWEPGVGWRTEPPTAGFAEASTSPTADFAVSADIPDGLTALATGTPDGNGRWRADRVRDFAISIGRFTTATAVAHAPDPVQVTVGVAAGIAEDPNTYLQKEVQALEDFSRRFGPYPWPTFTMAVEPMLQGGIEYPQHVMQGPGTGGRTTSHEIGHQWFYALVGNDQGRDPWLDEGLATYAEARFEGTVDRFLQTPIPLSAKGHAGDPMVYWESRQPTYYRGVYVQGAQAVAASGPAALVDCALRRYVERNAYRIATPSDLVRTFDETFPGTAARVAPYGIRLPS